ncbi:Crp/Fnr family transcriptional regulator [Sphingomonas sp. MG17]|jgi:CRP-like cAMP-binding protein|uniref:Crp/Fnr family transcriptional regulator n=1 Tax=Sphingomonas tagetis TaxID=2949092 RepID=A0A9X2KIZ5_9SPHN|nr:Crp/Fnr family transcriptional regulator [Sphingomonas tagetis]MCP3728889.1 Crp/Fnr family transcriptional regulator [Sphingomonas tagetis]
MIEAHLRRLRARHSISDAEEAAIRAAIGEIRDFPARGTLVEAGEEMSHSMLLLKGLICRYKDLSDGQRQITQVHVPGDFPDLHSFTLKKLDHSIMTLTPTRIAFVPHANLNVITERYPHLTRVYWFSTNLDAAIHREWELSLGRRTALGRCAHLLAEFRFRLEVVGLATKNGYDLPISQIDLSECLGLTPVHVNRSLRRLREDGIVTFRTGRVVIHDLARLEEAGEFDPAYLYPVAVPI